MTYREALVYRGTPVPELERVIARACDVRGEEDMERFLHAVAACTEPTLVVVASNGGETASTLLTATRAAMAWGTPNLKHFVTVASPAPRAREVIDAFRAGCHGFIRLPATDASILRGLPRALR